jgi:hypothetical protein
MTIFGYRLERRFWIIIGLALIGIVAIIIISGRGTDPAQERLANPAVTPEGRAINLSALAGANNWLEEYISYQGGLFEPQEFTPFTQLSVYSGVPFKTQVLIPSRSVVQSARPELLFTKEGWDFYPALFLTPEIGISEDLLAQKNKELNDGQPLLLGFPQGSFPGISEEKGFALKEITGLLYGHNAMLDPNYSGQQLLAPTLLVYSERTVDPVELIRPATHRADLNATYLQGTRALDVRSVEWSSGKEIRVCLRFSNRGTRPIPPWQGGADISSSFILASGQEGSPTVEIDENSTLGQSQPLQPGNSVEGYVRFTQPPAAGPQPSINLVIPALNDSRNEAGRTTLKITAQQFVPVEQSAKSSGGQATGGCALN